MRSAPRAGELRSEMDLHVAAILADKIVLRADWFEEASRWRRRARYAGPPTWASARWVAQVPAARDSPPRAFCQTRAASGIQLRCMRCWRPWSRDYRQTAIAAP